MVYILIAVQPKFPDDISLWLYLDVKKHGPKAMLLVPSCRCPSTIFWDLLDKNEWKHHKVLQKDAIVNGETFRRVNSPCRFLLSPRSSPKAVLILIIKPKEGLK